MQVICIWSCNGNTNDFYQIDSATLVPQFQSHYHAISQWRIYGGVRGGGGSGLPPPTSNGSTPHLQGPYLPRAFFITNVTSLLSLHFLILK